MTEAFNAFGTATPAASGLSVAHIMALKNMALRGGADINREPRIQPAYMESFGGFPMNEYIYMIDPDSYISLLADPAYTATAIGRGVVVDRYQPQIIHGADYVGKITVCIFMLCQTS